MRMVFQIVGGRQLWRGKGVDREYLRGNSKGELSNSEIETLDSLLEQVDELNLLKARAEYTLRHQPDSGPS